MKIATFQMPGSRPALGVVSLDATRILDAAALANSMTGSTEGYLSMLELIKSGPSALQQLKDWVGDGTDPRLRWMELPKVQLLAPLPNPRRLRCFSTYEKHLVQAFRRVLSHKLNKFTFAVVSGLGLIKAPKKFFTVPAYYKGNHLAIAGPDQIIVWPSYSEMLDYELELAMVIGKAGRDVPVGEALDYVFGYTVCNDFSARDALMGELGIGPSAGPAKGKDFDSSNAIGPWIVTSDEMGDPATAVMTVSVNGRLRGSAKAGDAAHSMASMIAYASRGETLCPGEILSCGAVGDGTGIESWQFLEPGDRVDLSIDRIGVLSNVIGEKPAIVALG